MVVAKILKASLLAAALASGTLPTTAWAQTALPSASASTRANSSEQEAFATPEAAMAAVVTALAANDTMKLLDIFGHDHAAVVLGADPANGRVVRERVATLLRRDAALRHEGPDKVVVVASNGWPMPIPLVRRGNGWMFDTAAGEEEILARRIGENELAAIATLHTLVDAERAYAAAHQQPGQPPQYARYVQSTPGRTNGLWWDAATTAKAGPSPLADFATANKPFLEGRKPGDPFRGYYFRILTAQGPRAPGGAHGYLQPDGKMTGGFAIIAWPAAWRESGVMTFLVGPDGKVLQRDLGPETQSVVDRTFAFAPGPDWVAAAPEPEPARR